MWIYLIPIAFICIILYFLNKRAKVKKINKKLSDLALEKGFDIAKYSSKEYNYILENADEIIYLRYIIIPKNSSITVNSKSTWCLRYGGGNRTGRSYPNKEYLNYLKTFLTTEYSSNKKVRKVVILYPTTEIILKYINESDIININQNDLVYGTQIIKFSEIEKYLF